MSKSSTHFVIFRKEVLFSDLFVCLFLFASVSKISIYHCLTAIVLNQCIQCISYRQLCSALDVVQNCRIDSFYIKEFCAVMV